MCACQLPSSSHSLLDGSEVTADSWKTQLLSNAYDLHARTSRFSKSAATAFLSLETRCGLSPRNRARATPRRECVPQKKKTCQARTLDSLGPREEAPRYSHFSGVCNFRSSFGATTIWRPVPPCCQRARCRARQLCPSGNPLDLKSRPASRQPPEPRWSPPHDIRHRHLAERPCHLTGARQERLLLELLHRQEPSSGFAFMGKLRHPQPEAQPPLLVIAAREGNNVGCQSEQFWRLPNASAQTNHARLRHRGPHGERCSRQLVEVARQGCGSGAVHPPGYVARAERQRDDNVADNRPELGRVEPLPAVGARSCWRLRGAWDGIRPKLCPGSTRARVLSAAAPPGAGVAACLACTGSGPCYRPFSPRL